MVGAQCSTNIIWMPSQNNSQFPQHCGWWGIPCLLTCDLWWWATNKRDHILSLGSHTWPRLSHVACKSMWCGTYYGTAKRPLISTWVSILNIRVSTLTLKACYININAQCPSNFKPTIGHRTSTIYGGYYKDVLQKNWSNDLKHNMENAHAYILWKHSISHCY